MEIECLVRVVRPRVSEEVTRIVVPLVEINASITFQVLAPGVSRYEEQTDKYYKTLHDGFSGPF